MSLLQKIRVGLLLSGLGLFLFPAVSLAAESDRQRAQLRWKSSTIRVAVSNSLYYGVNIKPDSDIAGAVKRAIESWQNSAIIDFVISESSLQNVSPSGVKGDGISIITSAQTPENLLLFSKGAESAPATTRIFFDSRGFITEADIVLNPYQQFSTDGMSGTFDLEAILVHEIGHLLGLEHSEVIGATMHEKIGKNGFFGQPGSYARTLSQDDVSAIRRLYGASIDVDCCGVISGRVNLPGSKSLVAEIWAEDAVSGRVIARSQSAADGSFRLGGISDGEYKVFAQGNGKATQIFAKAIGRASVKTDETVSIAKVLHGGRGNISLSYVGLNSQLSRLPVLLNAGQSSLLFVGGKNLDPKNVVIGFSSPYLTALNSTSTAHDFGDDLSVVSLEIRVDPEISPGEYSIFVESGTGERRYLVGAITIE